VHTPERGVFSWRRVSGDQEVRLEGGRNLPFESLWRKDAGKRGSVLGIGHLSYRGGSLWRENRLLWGESLHQEGGNAYFPHRREKGLSGLNSEPEVTSCRNKLKPR